MSKTPSFKAREVLEILFAAGFEKVRTSGSHIRLRKGNNLITVAWRSRGTVPKGTLKSIVKQSSMTLEQFLSFRKK